MKRIKQMKVIDNKTILFLIYIFSLGYTSAQSKEKQDSLLIQPKMKLTAEMLTFQVKFNQKKDIKNKQLRSVATMSCSCNDRDFYYTIYKLPDPEMPEKREIYLDHRELPETERCTCKSMDAQFRHGQKVSLPMPKVPGFYQLMIPSYPLMMYSNVFEVR